MGLMRISAATSNSALKSALFVLGIGMLVSCSPATRQFLFDIPPPEPEPDPELSRQESPAVDSASDAGQGTLQAIHPHDLEQDRPPIESVASWEEALALLPTSKKGEPDWSAALRQGIVKPRALEPSDREAGLFKLDFFMRSEKPKFDAWFPHSSHLQWMGCDSCHPAVFEYLDNEISMKQIRAGEACGACHGSVAFSPKDCKRCHTKM